MTIHESPEGKVVILSKAFDNKAKVLNIVYFLACTVGVLFFGFMYVETMSGSIALGTISLVALIAYMYGAYQFINKALQSERLVINEQTLTIMRDGFLSHRKEVYQNKLITRFRHLDKPDITDHPLAGQSFDYLGFQTRQAFINELHGDNRLAFEYEAATISFGENVYSWDFEELEMLLNNNIGQ